MTEQEKTRANVHHALRMLSEQYREQTNNIVDQCDDMECSACAVIMCPFGDAFHYHHDGCPSCVPSSGSITILSESELRTIHNALAVHQCSYKGDSAMRQVIQQLMDKIRDQFIAKYVRD